MPKQSETVLETVPETAKQISIEMVRLFRPIAHHPLRSGSALPSATLAAHRSDCKGEEVGIDLVTGNTAITPRSPVRTDGYMPASSWPDNWLSLLGHGLGHDKPGDGRLLRRIKASRSCHHRSTYPMCVGTAHSRAGERSRNLEMARDLREGGLRTRGWVGVAADPGARPIIDLPSIFRGPLPKTCDRLATSKIWTACPKNLGRP
jgi:hypothetical protein